MDLILGVSVTHRTVFASLVENRSDGPVVLRTFSRPRQTADTLGFGDDQDMSRAVPEESMGDPSVVFTIGASEKGSDLFLDSEFGGTGRKKAQESLGLDVSMPSVRTQTVEIELKEILAECADAGYPEVRVVITMGLSDLVLHELTLQESDKSEGAEGRKKGDRVAIPGFGKSRRPGSDRERWLRQLAKESDARPEADQVAFLPMTPSETGHRRLLAVFPRSGEPVVPTLERFVDRGRKMPRFTMIETEASLLLGMSRLLVPADEVEPRRRLTIRVGSEDTAILFLEGLQVRHFESLRSITKYDPPETISSRILLLQDEYGLGEADEILVLCDGDETELLDLLAEFFPDSHILNLRPVLPPFADEFERDDSRESALAAAVALRALRDPLGKGLFEPVDLLPQRLMRRRRKEIPISWQNYALLGLLFASTLFFVSRYLGQQEEIDRAQARLEEQYKKDVVERNKALLKARQDSLMYVIMGYDKALQVLDTLLYGSDRWSRAMELTASNAAAVSGVWIETWSEVDGKLVMSGTATDRNQIVRLAARMDGTIDAMTFSTIRDWPVFSYRMTVPLETDLPAAARYLREQVQLGLDVPVTETSGGPDDLGESASEPATGPAS